MPVEVTPEGEEFLKKRAIYRTVRRPVPTEIIVPEIEGEKPEWFKRVLGTCPWCGEYVFRDEDWVEHEGAYYHRECLRKQLKVKPMLPLETWERIERVPTGRRAILWSEKPPKPKMELAPLPEEWTVPVPIAKDKLVELLKERIDERRLRVEFRRGPEVLMKHKEPPYAAIVFAGPKDAKLGYHLVWLGGAEVYHPSEVREVRGKKRIVPAYTETVAPRAEFRSSTETMARRILELEPESMTVIPEKF